MRNALYPLPVEDKCPYCDSENVTNNMDDCQPTASGCSVQVDCADCGKSHYLNYKVETITLEDDSDPPNLVDYYVGYEIPDMGADDENKASKQLVAAVQANDGICIMAHGYGDGASTYGYGCPVIVELYEGELRSVHWNDINDDDAGPIIGLGGAKHEYEEPLSDSPYCVQVLTPDCKIIETHNFMQLHSGAIHFAEQFKLPHRHRIKVFDVRTKVVLHERKPGYFEG